MKKIAQAISITLVFGTIATVCSCKKTSTSPVVQSWTIDSSTYHPDTVARMNNILYAIDSIGLISFIFASLPTSSGIYKVGNPTAGPDQVYIEARNGTDFGSISGLVTVTVTSGKISVDAHNVWMMEAPMFKDSAKLSAQLTEQ